MTSREKELLAENAALKKEIVWLKEQLAALKQIVYGKRSDKTPAQVEGNTAQRSLFGEANFFDLSQMPLAKQHQRQPSPVQYKRVKGKLVKIKQDPNSQSSIN